MHEGQYVYCIIGTGEARNFGSIGMGGRGDVVTNIAYTDLSAVVSSVPMTRYVVSRDTMLAHEKIIERVMKEHTVLPVRFCTVAPNAEDVRNLLRWRYHEFWKLLRELDDKVELGLRVLWRDMDAIFREIALEHPETRTSKDKAVPAGAAPASQDKAAVVRMVKLALEEKKAQETDTLLKQVRGLFSSFCLNPVYSDEMVMNAAFLVGRAREREFDSRVEELSRQHRDRIEFKYVGPTPPYSFVNIVIKE